MKTRNIISIGILLVFLFGFIGSVSAITGSMGNARMVLRSETGETLEKSILVKNVNNVSLTIDLAAEGDLADDIKIQDTGFVLEPNSEKKAYFTIKVKEAGTSESKINVMFTPEEGNGIGLSSTIIVIAEEGDGWWGDDEEDDEADETYNEDDGADTPGVNVMTGNTVGTGTKGKMSNVKIGLLVTSGVFIIFLVTLVVLFKRTKKGIELSGETVETKEDIKKDVAGKSKKKVKRNE